MTSDDRIAAARTPDAVAGGRLAYTNREISVALWARRGSTRPGRLRAEVRHRETGPLASIPAWIVQEDEIRSRTTTDERGRFQLNLDDGGPVELWLVLAADEVLRLELDPAGIGLKHRPH